MCHYTAMLNATIHDSAFARLRAQSLRSSHFEEVLVAADEFVSAAALYLTATDAKAAGAADAFKGACKRYGVLLTANNGAFDLTTDAGLANVAQAVENLKATGTDIPQRWAKVVDSYTESDMDKVHVITLR